MIVYRKITVCKIYKQQLETAIPAHPGGNPKQYNIFTQAAGGAATVPRPESWQEGMLMSTYEEFMIILAFAGLIVSILNLTHKK